MSLLTDAKGDPHPLARVVPCEAAGHERESVVHENDDRTRRYVHCATCGKSWAGCLAKRLSDETDDEGNREWWGPVGVQTWREMYTGLAPLKGAT